MNTNLEEARQGLTVKVGHLGVTVLDPLTTSCCTLIPTKSKLEHHEEEWGDNTA